MPRTEGTIDGMRAAALFSLFLSLCVAKDCFNCAAGGECLHYSTCNNFTGICDCVSGFGGNNCKQPVCGSLAEGSRRPVRPLNSTCDCSYGWEGVNCNMCTEDESCEPFMPSPGHEEARCYKGGLLVDNNYHMCSVTNRKLLDILAGKKAEVSFGCSREDEACDLQLWVDQIESFFCKFENCLFNGMQYNCKNIKCQCQPGELLCGKEGSIDITEWLQKSVHGPGDLECDESGKCKFEEPAMNQLIQYVFGDKSIELQCGSSECLHYSEVPGYELPTNPRASTFAIVTSVVLAGLVFALLGAAFRYVGNESNSSSASTFGPDQNKPFQLANEEPVARVTPVGLYFDKVRYIAPSGKEILGHVSGAVPPGHVLAIMGGSGAGKTTLLDILGAKCKRGRVEGEVRLNNSELTHDSPLRNLVGYVDQSDSSLIPTQTVYEHVLFSALLRLPRSMSRATKEFRVLDTLSELGILHLRNQLVGKGLSGGERRRVVIACELVTSPSVLLLDEPTSGLDAFSAFSVVETLVNLAKTANRTVAFTIHQPRSNIVSLFDRIMLLAQGQLVYTGTVAAAEGFFEGLGHSCPANYNFADYIVDLSMKAALTPYTDEDDPAMTTATSEPNVNAEDVLSDASGEEEDALAGDNEETIAEECPDPQVHTMPLGTDPPREWQDFAFHRAQISRTAAQAMATSQLSLGPQGLEPLILAFRTSIQFTELQQELEQSSNVEANQGSPSLVESSSRIKRAKFWEQFQIIASRIFRNLYRDPMLVLTHYGISVGLGVLCGYLYFHVENDISGFQNRLGLFFFLLSVFGFSTLTTVSLFGRERIIFMRERSNGYYNPLAYYMAKVLLDIVPLRIGPPLLLGLILYPLVGLNLNDGAPFMFLLVLALFNLSAATMMLVIGILVADFSVASLIGCMVNLFGILFAGLFLNQDSMPSGSVWAKYLSIYHYAYEALSVNEVKYLTLTEDKFGLKIEVPGATILSAFGFDNSSLVRDAVGLAITAVLSVVLGYFVLNKVLVERR